MKKISVLKVVLLTIVTLGLYAIYWAARNRDYIKNNDKKAGFLPAWGWLVSIPAAGFVVVGTAIILMIIATFGGISADTTIVALNVLFAAYTVFATVVGVWWVWHFSKAMEKVTHGSLTRGWAVALFIFIGPLLAAFYQFYINKSAEEKATAKHEPSSVFAFLAIGAMAISLIGTVINTTDYIRSIPTLKTELVQAQESTRGLTDAYKAYARCDAEFIANYPNGKPSEAEKQAVYTAHLERCHVLHREYEKTIDAISR